MAAEIGGDAIPRKHERERERERGREGTDWKDLGRIDGRGVVGSKVQTKERWLTESGLSAKTRSRDKRVVTSDDITQF